VGGAGAIIALARVKKRRLWIDICRMELTLRRTMRGEDKKQSSMLMLMSPETRVPQTHPLRAIKKLADEALAKLSPVFDAMYAEGGRPSIPPERLLKSMLLIAPYSVRSERPFCEQLDYNLLFRWFLGMDMVEASFVPTVFTHNRDRLIVHDAAGEFLRAIVEQARENRNGLVLDLQMDVADGHAERRNALEILDNNLPGQRRITVGGDKGYDTSDFIEDCRERNVTPHVAQNITRRRGSNIDERTTGHAGYAINQRVRKRIEEVFGWVKTVGNFRKTRYIGLGANQLAAHLLATAYNLLRVAKLSAAT
jgi:transposase